MSKSIKNGWEIKKLSEIITTVESGSRPKGGVDSIGDIPSLGAEHLDNSGGFNFDKIKMITKEFFASMKKGIIETNDILLVKDGATTGKVSFVDNDFPYQKSSINEHLFKIKINNQIASAKYIFFYLSSSLGQSQILSDFRGATVGGISRNFLEVVEIPLPPLEEQIKIAEILEKADKLRQKRKEANKLYDELLQSIFLDMFGDPVSNPKGWEIVEVGKVTQCLVPSRDKPKSFTGNIPWITTEDLVNLGNIYTSKKGYFLSLYEIKEVKNKIIPENSVIMTCVGDLGVISINKKNVVINQQLHSFQCSEKINNVFLQFNLSFQKEYMYNKASSTTVAYMNKSVCNSIPVLLPPIELQNKFAEIVEKIEAMKEKAKKAEEEIENLFNALMQKAFSGGL